MSRDLIAQALRAKARKGKFRPSQALARYLQDNNIGATERGVTRLGPRARAELDAALERDFQVPPGTQPDEWAGLSRTEALALTTNEKSASRAVRSRRVAVKSLGGQELRMRGTALQLLDGISLDTSADDADAFSGHAMVILVENWEAFERIHALNFKVDSALQEALVVFRGDQGAYPIAAAREFLAELGRPVHVFPDADPAGLLIALRIPRYAGLVLPSTDALAAHFNAGRGDALRYTNQLPGCEAALEASTDPDIASYWGIIKAAGRALPQEEFVR